MSANPRLGPHREHTTNDPCEICGGVRCITFDDGGTICRRVESDHPLTSGWYHETEPSAANDRTFRVVDPEPGSERLPDDELDAIHRSLIELLPLDDGGGFDGEHVGFRRPPRTETISSGAA